MEISTTQKNILVTGALLSVVLAFSGAPTIYLAAVAAIPLSIMIHSTGGGNNMSIFNRASKVVEANLNDLITKMEDPTKMIPQLIMDYKKDLMKAKSETAEAMANLSRAKAEIQEIESRISVLKKVQKAAADAGNASDELAVNDKIRELQIIRDTRNQILEAMTSNVNRMTSTCTELEHDIKTLEYKKSEIDQKLGLAKAKNKLVAVSETKKRIDPSSKMLLFDRLNERADRELAISSAKLELTSGYNRVDSIEDIVKRYSVD